MKVLASALVAILSTGGATAAEVKPVGKTGTSLEIRGAIAPGDDQRLLQAARSLQRAGNKLERLFLNSPGGQLRAGLALAVTVGELNVDTVVGAGATCASACVLAFAAGKKKVAFATSMIGVHAATSVETNSLGEEMFADDDRAKVATVNIAPACMPLWACLIRS